MNNERKDYSSISPSAKSLLLMKGYTDIPYAREAAGLMKGPEVFDLSFSENDFWFWVRVMHFEVRYKSINQLLSEITGNNVLELSSGFSFRGAELCTNSPKLHYIDTDLPEVIAVKQKMMADLHTSEQLQGKLELLPLNALDEKAFATITERFADGPINIVNEGLLMYLNTEEKQQICNSIRNILKQRRGYWITADVYVKRPEGMQENIPQSKSEASFFQQHQIEENKFDSYEAARIFFLENGLEFIKEAIPNYPALSVFPQIMKVLPEEARNNKQPPPKIQATWMLRAI